MVKTETRHFIHYAPQGDFEEGIFVPYNTQEEAERQVAFELMNGSDPEIYQQTFSAPYLFSTTGWTRKQLNDQSFEHPHLKEANRSRTGTPKQLLERAKKHAHDLMQEQIDSEIARITQIHEEVMRGSHWNMAVPGNAYVWNTGGTATAVPAALSAATAKTVVLILASTANQPALTEIGVSFDGVTATAVPALVELVSGTAGAAGTPRAALAVGKQLRGWPAQNSQTTVGDTYAAEPTTQLVNRKWFVSPYGGLWTLQFPLGREPTGIVTATTDAKTWSLRVTAPATVNCHAYIEFEE